MPRRLLAIAVGLVLPLGVSLAIVHAAGERVGATYVHVHRAGETLPLSTYVLTPFELAHLPAEFRDALALAASTGEAAIRLRGSLDAAWTRLRAQAGGAEAIAAHVDGVSVVLEARGPTGWAERTLAGIEATEEWIAENARNAMAAMPLKAG